MFSLLGTFSGHLSRQTSRDILKETNGEFPMILFNEIRYFSCQSYEYLCEGKPKPYIRV